MEELTNARQSLLPKKATNPSIRGAFALAEAAAEPHTLLTPADGALPRTARSPHAAPRVATDGDRGAVLHSPLRCCSQLWGHRRRRDTDLLQPLQRRDTEML